MSAISSDIWVCKYPSLYLCYVPVKYIITNGVQTPVGMPNQWLLVIFVMKITAILVNSNQCRMVIYSKILIKYAATPKNPFAGGSLNVYSSVSRSTRNEQMGKVTQDQHISNVHEQIRI